MQSAEQVESWQRTKELKEVMSQYPDEDTFNEESVKLALQLQFDEDLDLQRVRKRIMDSIENKVPQKEQRDRERTADHAKLLQ